MARNDPAAYGRSLRVWDDADDVFSTVTGIDVVVQLVYHKLTNDTVMGPGGEEWGIDVTKFAGMDPARLSRRGPVIKEVLERDERIGTADVRVNVTQINFRGTLYAGSLDITCYTAQGPFRRIFGFNDKTVADITAILEGAS